MGKQMAEKLGRRKKRGGKNTLKNSVLPLLDVSQSDFMASRTTVILIV